MEKKKKPKKENKQVVEIHIYIHQFPDYGFNSAPTQPNTTPYPWKNPPITIC
jgi:hypothetical protein